MSEGYGRTFRRDLMYNNDFVIIGPQHDPFRLISPLPQALIMRLKNSLPANSLSLAVTIAALIKPNVALLKNCCVRWTTLPISAYQEVGNGMGATINIAVETKAYTLTDRSTWIAYNNKRDAKILSAATLLFTTNMALFRSILTIVLYAKKEAALRFVDQMLSAQGQNAIANYRRFDTSFSS